MSSLDNKLKIIDTKGDLLQMSNSGLGVDGTVRTVRDGAGNATPLKLSTSYVYAANMTFNGNTITTTTGAITINSASGTNNFGTSSGAIVTIGNSTGTTNINGTVVFGTTVSYTDLTISGTATIGTSATTSLTVNGKSISPGGNWTSANAFTISGNFATTLTVTGATNVTLPTSGTLLTTLTGDVTTSGSAATIANLAVTTAKINTKAVTYAKIQDTVGTSVLIGNLSGSTGAVSEQTITSAAVSGLSAVNVMVQRKYVESTSVVTDTTHITLDASSPQNTEGSQAFTLAITPLNSSNILTIEGVLQVGANNTDHVTVALFQDSTATCLSCNTSLSGTLNAVSIPFRKTIIAGTTSATTFKIRFGAVSATSAMNAIAGTATTQGGSWVSSMTITETTP